MQFAVLLTMASMGRAQGLGVQYVAPARDTPVVWLYWSKSFLILRLEIEPSLTDIDDNGVEKYTPDRLAMTLNNKCHSHLGGYLGVWVEKDPRPASVRVGCVRAYENDGCDDKDHSEPYPLPFSGQSFYHTCRCRRLTEI